MIEEVVSFCSDLIKCKSVTPTDDGVLERIRAYLLKAGFEVEILTFSSSDGKNPIKNLYAKYGSAGSGNPDDPDSDSNKVLGFLGHSDVVPAGGDWEVDPFAATIKDGYLYGRGVCDMKGGIAAFCCAVSEFIKRSDFDKSKNSIVIMITGDEEVGSPQGARALIDWCKEHGTMPRDCLIGEPSSNKEIGDRVYVGHRGSLNILAKSKGKQGHIAYLGSYKNSLADICNYVAHMMQYEWKHEDKSFPKTNLEPTMLFTNNYAVNVAPDESSVNLNIRYGSDYNCEELTKICLQESEKFGISLEFSPSGDAYCCRAEGLRKVLEKAIRKTTDNRITPKFSCSGGISDGRYMLPYCNIIEFGLQDSCIHQKNEKAKLTDLVLLARIYDAFLDGYFLDNIQNSHE